MALVLEPPVKLGLLQIPNPIRLLIWEEVLSEKEYQNMQSQNRLVLLLTCRTIHFDLGKLWPRALLENRTFTFPTLESFLKSAPMYTHDEQVLIRSVHIQFHETLGSEHYHGSHQVPYWRHKFILDEILLPKYHGIREWIIDVSNLFSGLGTDTPTKFFMQRFVSYFLRYCSAERFKLVFNTCNGSILNCAQPREGFTLEEIQDCDLLDFEVFVEELLRPLRRWTVPGDRTCSTMLIFRRPTIASRGPNPKVPYHTYYNDRPEDPWREIKASVREKITHGAKWKLEIWKRPMDTKLDAVDMANASLILPSRIQGLEKFQIGVDR